MASSPFLSFSFLFCLYCFISNVNVLENKLVQNTARVSFSCFIFSGTASQLSWTLSAFAWFPNWRHESHSSPRLYYFSSFKAVWLSTVPLRMNPRFAHLHFSAGVRKIKPTVLVEKNSLMFGRLVTTSWVRCRLRPPEAALFSRGLRSCTSVFWGFSQCNSVGVKFACLGTAHLSQFPPLLVIFSDYCWRPLQRWQISACVQSMLWRQCRCGTQLFLLQLWSESVSHCPRSTTLQPVGAFHTTFIAPINKEYK